MNDAAEINPRGRVVRCQQGRGGVPPGKYKVKVNVTLAGTDPTTLTKQAELNKRFSVLDGKEYDVPADADNQLKIDTTTGTVTKG